VQEEDGQQRPLLARKFALRAAVRTNFERAEDPKFHGSYTRR
jgi:hypothetical protein